MRKAGSGSAGSQMRKGLQSLLGLLIIVVVFVIASPTFRTFDNFATILTQAVILGIMAVGPTVVLIAGGLDLSIGSLYALVAVCGGWMLYSGFPVIIVVIVSLAIGAAGGALNGAIILGTGIPAFIGTLGMMKLYRGLAEIFAANKDMSRFPASFQGIGGGYAIPIAIMVVTFVVSAVFLSRSKLGFNAYAIGGSNEVARLAGVPVKRYYLIYYTFGGFVAGLSAIVGTSRLNFANPSFGNGMELDAIAAVIIGGTSLSGGVGGVGRTVIGVLIITTLYAGLSHLGVSSSWQRISVGVVIIFAVWLDFLQRRRESKA
jgi:ribose/xylose/arabinose/galactoside ABC-type transport system permease subunit